LSPERYAAEFIAADTKMWEKGLQWRPTTDTPIPQGELFAMVLKLPARIIVAVALLCSSTRVVAAEPSRADQAFRWPQPSRESRPWSYWWWLGSAVDETYLTRELQRYHDAGWGGVHIIPIYGAKGFEEKYIPYLSRRWMQMLRHACEEADRMDMRVDMTTGTGWCFGGPEVTDVEAAAVAAVRTIDVRGGEKLAKEFTSQGLQALTAIGDQGQSVDLLGRLAADGHIDWTAPDGSWRVYAVAQQPTSRVKRAAPGGEGYMLNPLYDEALRHYLERFEQAFAEYDGLKPRAMYHDSFEYRVNWSPNLLDQFSRRRGYRLQEELPSLFGKETTDRVARVKSDYRETMSDMLIEDSLPLWTAWCREHGFLTRNQAHGSPGNLLDLYELADIPETEMFNKDRRPVVAKFASSAAHVTGRNLVASESGTWLMEHFTETLAEIKYLLDDLFLAGVNHVIFHGTCYSPDEVAWPGWLFYASTEMNPRNPVWRDVPALASYITRCQSVLQAGRPDNDVLVYWPIYDNWHDPAGLQMNFSVHGAGWCIDKPIGQLAQRLYQRGFAFDYISDRQLRNARTDGDAVLVPGGTYRAVVVPACDRMPIDTLQQLLSLAEKGATVIFESHLPSDVPGLHDLEHRQRRLRELLDSLTPAESAPGLQVAKRGSGRVLIGECEPALGAAGVVRETLTDTAGLLCVRRALDEGRYYFLANRGGQPLDGWIPLSCAAESVVAMNPLTGQIGRAEIRGASENRIEVRLQLQPGESVILRTGPQQVPAEPTWHCWRNAGQPTEITGIWQLQFTAGGPELPPPVTVQQLISWTDLPGAEMQRFAGTARYSIEFRRPASGTDTWFLHLGRVCQSARVRLNGRDLGTVICPPFRLPATGLKPEGNTLEVEVTNVAANRIRFLDQEKIPWRNFHDINLVNMDYKPFDASTWPLTPSGLLGPVTLEPVESTLVQIATE
jgi:hypothetical protein